MLSGKKKIRLVLQTIPDLVDHIYCIDDACPDHTGDYIEQNIKDVRLKIIAHKENLGVGGATISGYNAAIMDGADIVAKIDGDGQMDPTLIHRFIQPILDGKADYTKGNRFYRLENLSGMPVIRLFGNALLSFMSKFSTGYWQIFDPNNGYTAIHTSILKLMPLNKINNGYLFESDLLFRLNIVRAVVRDIPIPSIYADETSSLLIRKELFSFFRLHVINFFKRIFYNYYLRDFSIASLEWVIGPASLTFGIVFGIVSWNESINIGIEATAGTVMLAALPTIIGLQLSLSALSFDIKNNPTIPVHATVAD